MAMKNPGEKHPQNGNPTYKKAAGTKCASGFGSVLLRPAA